MGFLDKLVGKEIEDGDSLKQDLENISKAKNGRTAVLVEYKEDNGNHKVVALNKSGHIVMVYDHRDPLNIASRIMWGNEDIHGDHIDEASRVSKESDINRYHIFSSTFSFSPDFVEYLTVIYSDYTIQKLYELDNLFANNIDSRNITDIKDYEVSKLDFYNKSISSAFQDVEEARKRTQNSIDRINYGDEEKTLSLIISDAIGLDDKEDTDKVLIAASEAGSQTLKNVKLQSTGFLFADIIERLARANERGWIKIIDPDTNEPISSFKSRSKDIPDYSSSQEKKQEEASDRSVENDDFTELDFSYSENQEHDDEKLALEIISHSGDDNPPSEADNIEDLDTEEDEYSFAEAETEVEEAEKEEGNDKSINEAEEEDYEDSEEEPLYEQSETGFEYEDGDEVASDELLRALEEDSDEEHDLTHSISSEELLSPSNDDSEEDNDEENNNTEDDQDNSELNSQVFFDEDITHEVEGNESSQDEIQEETDNTEDSQYEDSVFSVSLDDDDEKDYDDDDDEYSFEENENLNNVVKNLPIIDQYEVSTVSAVSEDESNDESSYDGNPFGKNKGKRDLSAILQEMIQEKNEAKDNLERIPAQVNHGLEEMDRAKTDLEVIESEIYKIEQELDEARERKDKAIDYYEHLSRIVDEKHSFAIKARHKYFRASTRLEKLNDEKEIYTNSITSIEKAIDKVKSKKPELINELMEALEDELDSSSKSLENDDQVVFDINNSEKENEIAEKVLSLDLDPDQLDSMENEGGGVVRASKVDSYKFRGDFIDYLDSKSDEKHS